MWEVFTVKTLSGVVGPQLDVASGSWSEVVNGSGEITVKVPTKQLLETIEREFWSPWMGSLLAVFDGEPIALGVITELPDGDSEFVTLRSGVGLWDLLDHRMATDGDFVDGEALATSMLSLTEGSLGTIARRLVEKAQLRPAGWFPISYASPVEEGTNRVRNYKGFNLGNNSVAKLLKEITEVQNGPDISFRCGWVEPYERVEWVMHHGTEGMPTIGQAEVFTVDLTAPRSSVRSPKLSAKHTPFSRVYATGAGQDEGTLVRIVDVPVTESLPWLETVISETQAEDPNLLVAKANGLLDDGEIIQLTVEADELPLHRFWAGDEMTVVQPAGWIQLGEGVYQMRLIGRSGSLTSSKVSLGFQPIELG